MRSYKETVEALNEMIPEIHENAVAHGWWENDREISEIYVLIHSELSEALEEYRSGKPDVYCAAHGSDWCPICYGDTCAVSPDTDCLTCFAQRAESGKVPNKAEGVITELADAVIRIMDYLGKYGKEIKRLEYSEIEGDKGNFTDMLAGVHTCLSLAYYQAVTRNSLSVQGEPVNIAVVVRLIWEYTNFRGYDLAQIVRIKHEYNKTRPYKHGGKRI